LYNFLISYFHTNEAEMMERSDWLKKMRLMAERLYDHFGSAYWVKFGHEITPIHRKFMEKFLGRLNSPGTILDAACGAGLYDGMLVEAGHTVLGIDQSGGMLNQARSHYPRDQYPDLHYLKMGLQDIDFQSVFDGVICMDAMEHICPEDWPGIVAGFNQALKPRGLLYVTVDAMLADEYRESYELAKAMGLPVVYGEQVDDLEAAYSIAMQQDPLDPNALSGERLDHTVYHYHPTMEQVRAWLTQAGFMLEEEYKADEVLEEYMHVLASKYV
jgi:2-polyprenyl-3-methyl-5-hydroxy-6-metoxy-1,4-benzoquinol methylase